MFQRRLIIFIVLLVLGLAVLITRLAWLQIVDSPRYLRQASELLEQSPQWLETVRGSIIDYKDRILADDRPTFDLCLSYQLTRLYDDAFWKDQHRIYLAYSKSPYKESLSEEKYLHKNFGQQLDQAQEIIGDLSAICRVRREDIQKAITDINENILRWRTSRARRKWYLDNHKQYVPTHADTLQEDFALEVPNEAERLKLIFATDLSVMRTPQRVFSVSRETALVIEEKFGNIFLNNTNGIQPVVIRTGKERIYPYQDVACHLIGQLGPVPQQMLSDYPADKNKPTQEELSDYYGGDRKGDWAVECLFEERLRGRRGWVKYNIDRDQIDQISRQLGQDVKLTIDIELQKDIQRILQGENDQAENYRGAAVIIDVPTGQIRAMVSVPTFDLNTYYQTDQFKLIRHDQPGLYWTNRAISHNYQPGSTIKPTLLLGGLQKKIVSPNTVFDCPGRDPTIMNRPQCWSVVGHGEVDYHLAIKQSCNNYFIHLAENWGSQALVAWLKHAGFGRGLLAWPSDTCDRAESAFSETAGDINLIGRTAPPALFDLRYMSIGRGALDGSVLQIANSMATIARDGILVRPSLVITPPVASEAVPIASPENAQLVGRAMQAVIYEIGGLAHSAFDEELNLLPWPREVVTLHGKTGSTENSIFAGFARCPDGRCLAWAVLVEIEASGSDIAAPLARRILLACASHGYLPAATTLPDSTLPTSIPVLQ